ncbi:MAG: alpha/beta hydrolase, partial [Acidimicrobiales bacterium]
LAAGLSPKGSYRSVVLMSSSTSTPGLEPLPGTPTFPRNIEVVEAKYSEFSQLMWAVPKGSEIPDSPRLMALFGTKSPVIPGKVYGSIANGTGRRLYIQSTTHPGITFDPSAIAHVVSWEQATLTGVSPLATSNQIWLWDEFGTFLALMGVGLFLFGAAGELLRLDFFSGIIRTQPTNRAMTGLGWWFGALIFAVLGPLTFFDFQTWGENTFKAGPFFPENIPTGVIVWAIGDIIIGMVLFLIWHFTTKSEKRGNLHSYGLAELNARIEWPMVGKTVLFGLAAVFVTYIPVYFFHWAFTSDVRLWIFNIKRVDYTHAKIGLDYLPFFALYFIGLSVIIFGQLRPRTRTLAGFMGATMGLLVVGFAVFIALEYGVLLATGELLTSSQPLLAIVAFQFIPLYLLIGAILAYFFYRTGRIYAGVVIASLFVTAIVVAGTATQGVVW